MFTLFSTACLLNWGIEGLLSLLVFNELARAKMTTKAKNKFNMKKEFA